MKFIFNRNIQRKAALFCIGMVGLATNILAQTDTTQKVVNRAPAVFQINQAKAYIYEEKIVDALSKPRNLIGLSPQSLFLSGIDLSYSRISSNWHIKFGGAFYTSEESVIFRSNSNESINSNTLREFDLPGDFDAFRIEFSPRKVFKSKSNPRTYLDAGIFLNFRQIASRGFERVRNSSSSTIISQRNFNPVSSSVMLGPIIGLNKFFGDVWYFSADIGVGMVIEVQKEHPDASLVVSFPIERGMHFKSSFTIGIFL